MEDYKEKIINLYNKVRFSALLEDSLLSKKLEEAFPELKEESEDDRIRKALIHLVNSNKELYFGVDNYDGIKWSDILAWLEKQGEQKSANKVKPKFHEGDWVVNKFGDVWHIDSFDKKNYQVSDGKGNYNYFPILKQDEMHLWTIKDAKCGDVLADGNLPFIFKKIDANKYIYAYCGISVDDGFKIESDGESGEWTWMQDMKPATKEQRDQLEKAMANAGYRWNAEKKELRKIEQKLTDEELKKLLRAEYEKGRAKGKAQTLCEMPKEIDSQVWQIANNAAITWEQSFAILMAAKNAYDKGKADAIVQTPVWSEDDEKMWLSAIEYVRTHPAQTRSVVEWLKSLKERVIPQPKQEWSEEDERIVTRIVESLSAYADKLQYEGFCHNSEVLYEQIDWLKFIKERYTWKPSDEQMEALDSAIHCYAGISPTNNREVFALEIMKEQLKKLRGE